MMSQSRPAPIATAALFGLALSCALIGGPAEAQIVPPLRLTPVVSGLVSPVGIVSANDASGRLFIVEQGGTIRIWDGTELLPDPFLSIPVLCCGERGLLGLAFHPRFSTNGYFFVHYSNPNGGDGATVVSRFQVTSDPDVADPASEVVLLTQPQPYSNHNGGQIAFGPDEYLYVALGDGGSANDPQNHGQNRGDLLGAILRLDVPVDPADPNPRLAIPGDNPFVGVPGAREEIWAYGLRNPWRFSFDRLTGDLFIADVGQGRYEEINFQLAGSPGGENYGWRLMEGSSCFNPSSGCNDGTLTLPVLEYDHSQGCSVTGGYRYRGRRYPSLAGIFFFGDYCSGLVWGGVEDATGAWTRSVALPSGLLISTFGEDEDGEIYLANYSSGVIFRLEADIEPPRITAPAAGTVLPAGGSVTALGTGSNLSWRADRLGDALGDLATGTGPSITFTVPADSTAQQEILVELTGDGGVDRLIYPIAPLLPPLEAVATAEPASGTAPLQVQFTGAASGGMGPYSFEWSFGDGSPLSMEPSPVYVYPQPGSFTAVLTVRDAAFATATVEIPIEVLDVASPGFDCASVVFLRAFSRGEQVCAPLASGGLPYTDDARAVTAMSPALEGTAWIRMANADAGKRGLFYLFLRVSEPVKVVVGFDAAAERLPAWLRRRWTAEGESVTLEDGRVLDLYAREYAAGWVLLRPNRSGGAAWPDAVEPLHYVVALTPSASAPSPTTR